MIASLVSSPITITEFNSDFALFKQNGIEYSIDINESEVLEIVGEISWVEDSGYGKAERHETVYKDAEWQDVCKEHIIEYIKNNTERWERE
jgi:hypothetical protein